MQEKAYKLWQFLPVSILFAIHSAYDILRQAAVSFITAHGTAASVAAFSGGMRYVRYVLFYALIAVFLLTSLGSVKGRLRIGVIALSAGLLLQSLFVFFQTPLLSILTAMSLGQIHIIAACLSCGLGLAFLALDKSNSLDIKICGWAAFAFSLLQQLSAQFSFLSIYLLIREGADFNLWRALLHMNDYAYGSLTVIANLAMALTFLLLYLHSMETYKAGFENTDKKDPAPKNA